MLPFGESDWTRGTLPILMSNVKTRHDRMVELVERMLKLRGRNRWVVRSYIVHRTSLERLTADGLRLEEHPWGS